MTIQNDMSGFTEGRLIMNKFRKQRAGWKKSGDRADRKMGRPSTVARSNYDNTGQVVVTSNIREVNSPIDVGVEGTRNGLCRVEVQ
jgi:hypothetical protein